MGAFILESFLIVAQKLSNQLDRVHNDAKRFANCSRRLISFCHMERMATENHRNRSQTGNVSREAMQMMRNRRGTLLGLLSLLLPTSPLSAIIGILFFAVSCGGTPPKKSAGNLPYHKLNLFLYCVWSRCWPRLSRGVARTEPASRFFIFMSERVRAGGCARLVSLTHAPPGLSRPRAFRGG